MDGANGLEKGFLEGSLMINLDTEEEGELCIGCAGGRDVNVTFGFQPDKRSKKGRGLQDQLNRLERRALGCADSPGKSQANKLMNRFLKDVVSNYEAA